MGKIVEPLDIATSILSTYRSWSRCASDLGSEERLVLVDNLAEQICENRGYQSLREVELDLSKHLSRLDELPAEYRNHTKEKLYNSLTFIKQLKGEAPADLDTYLARGSIRVNVNETELRREHQSLSILPPDAPHRTSVEEVAELSEEIARKYAKILPSVDVPKFSVIESRSSVPFAMVVTCKQGPIVLEVCNLDYTSHSDLYNMLIHEVGHIVHLSELRKNTSLQREAPHLLAMSMHTQESYYLEFVAQYLHLVFLDYLETSECIKDGFKRSNIVNGVVYKNLMDILKGEKTLEQAAEFHAEFTEGEPSLLVSRYELMATHPFGTAQIGSYYPSFLNAKKYHDRLGTTEEKVEVVIRNYHTPYTLKRLVE